MNTEKMGQDHLLLNREQINSLTGFEKAWAFLNWSRASEGYLTPDELIEDSLQNGFMIDSPFMKIKKGTTIAKGAILKNGTYIDGDDVQIGSKSELDNAQIIGTNIQVGEGNQIRGVITPNNVTIGNNNKIYGLNGINQGTLSIGNHNIISEIKITNTTGQFIKIGNHNELHTGLSINCIFPKGRIVIGNHNSLGRDGGGVISNSYRYNYNWWGDVLIGNHVETTRGAEILGFSMLGWPLSDQDMQRAKKLFIEGPMDEIQSFFENQWEAHLPDEIDEKEKVSLFGVAKVKMCFLGGIVKISDDTRIQSSFVKNLALRERCKVYFTSVDHNLPKPIRIDGQDVCLEFLDIKGEMDTKNLPTEPKTNGYRRDDASFYE